MAYQKPAIVHVVSALFAIQGTMKSLGQIDGVGRPSTPAYESDE